MSRRSARCVASNLIVTAGAAALAGLGTSNADAGLLIDVRATGATTAGPGVVNPKSVGLSSPGDTVTLGVFASVTGTDGVNNEMFQSVYGSLQSTGSLKGNLAGGYATNDTGASQNGSVLDWDSDGDLDIGSAGSTTTGKFFARNAPALGMPSIGGDVLIGQFVFTVTNASGYFEANFVVRKNGTDNISTTGLWFEDGGTISKSPTNSPLTVGPPVVDGPEPSSLSAVALSAIGLLSRRRAAAPPE